MKKDSLTFRILLILGIIVLLLIPLIMIQSLIHERQGYRAEAEQEIYDSWASEQIVAGPILTITKEYQYPDTGRKKSITKNYLPENLNITCELVPEIRYRGIYEVILYKSKIKINGSFPSIDKIEEEENLRAVNKHLSFNITDLRGIEETVRLKVNDKDLTVVPGLKNDRLFNSGFLSDVSFNDDKILNFDCELDLKGSSGIEFMPLGKTTSIDVNSDWNNPSFTGTFLPSERSVSDTGFAAQWKISHFNREYPQSWSNQRYELYASTFGVDLLMPVDEYQKTMRTSKYGIMIIVLTFISFFMIEIFSKKVIHPVQYLLVGLSLVIFYSLLLSISEYIVFKYSYLISSAAVLTLIGLYVKSIYSSVKISLIITSILAMFYGFMYVILQVQDYAILFGNIALFSILGLIMYLTRKLNWFELFNANKAYNNETA